MTLETMLDINWHDLHAKLADSAGFRHLAEAHTAIADRLAAQNAPQRSIPCDFRPELTEIRPQTPPARHRFIKSNGDPMFPPP